MESFINELEKINSYTYSAISLHLGNVYIGLIFCNKIEFDYDFECLCFYNYDDIVFSLNNDFNNKQFSYKISAVNSIASGISISII
jgi:hypothetical protein